MKRKVSLILTAAALVAVMVVTGTLAFFTDSKTVNNVVTTGNLKIKLDETKVTEDGENIYTDAQGKTKRVQEGQTYEIMPKTELYKDPIVTNVSSYSGWLRVKITIASNDKLTYKKDGKTKTTDSIVTDQIMEQLNQSQAWEKENGKVKIDTENATDGGFYVYYKGEFKPGDTVLVFDYKFQDFFDQVEKEYGINAAQNAKFNIDVAAEAIQYENNSSADWSQLNPTASPTTVPATAPAATTP